MEGTLLDDWWDWNYADIWEEGMKEDGFVVLPADREVFYPAWRMAVLAEMRWDRIRWRSRLWDGRPSDPVHS